MVVLPIRMWNLSPSSISSGSNSNNSSTCCNEVSTVSVVRQSVVSSKWLRESGLFDSCFDKGDFYKYRLFKESIFC
jgi:hypothetical protein